MCAKDKEIEYSAWARKGKIVSWLLCARTHTQQGSCRKKKLRRIRDRGGGGNGGGGGMKHGGVGRSEPLSRSCRRREKEIVLPKGGEYTYAVCSKSKRDG